MSSGQGTQGQTFSQYAGRGALARMTRLLTSWAGFAEGDAAPLSVDDYLRLRTTHDSLTADYSRISTADTNAVLIASGAGALWNLEVFNNSSTIAYLKLYDLAVQPDPTNPAHVPFKRLMIPGISGGSGFIRGVARGRKLTLGLGMVLVSGIADSNAVAVAANAYLVNIEYELGGG